MSESAPNNEKEPNDRALLVRVQRMLLISGLTTAFGALVSLLVLLYLLTAKFATSDALPAQASSATIIRWIALVILPLTIVLVIRLRRYFEEPLQSSDKSAAD